MKTRLDPTKSKQTCVLSVQSGSSPTHRSLHLSWRIFSEGSWKVPESGMGTFEVLGVQSEVSHRGLREWEREMGMTLAEARVLSAAVRRVVVSNMMNREEIQ